jgi:hypothetical protein
MLDDSAHDGSDSGSELATSSILSYSFLFWRIANATAHKIA